MSNKPKETLTKKCKRLEAEIKKLNRIKFNLERREIKLENQKLALKKENMVLRQKLSKKVRGIEDVIKEANEEQSKVVSSDRN